MHRSVAVAVVRTPRTSLRVRVKVRVRVVDIIILYNIIYIYLMLRTKQVIRVMRAKDKLTVSAEGGKKIGSNKHK